MVKFHPLFVVIQTPGKECQTDSAVPNTASSLKTQVLVMVTVIVGNNEEVEMISGVTLFTL